MGSMLSGNRLNKEEMEVVSNKAKEIVSTYPVVVFSKTYCPYCTKVKQLLTQLALTSCCLGKTYCPYCKKVKQLLTQLRASFEVLELNEISDGGEIQSALFEWTGQRTVPSVFIGGKHIGGCDKMMETNKLGKLVPVLTEACALTKTSSKL